jgi:ATP-binding cassette subfamily F protein 3
MIPKVRSLLGAFLFRGDDVFKPLEVLSGGERNRVAMVELLLRPVNLLILDEPTNHLDMTSKDVLLEALEHFPGTVLFVSHDRYFSEKLAQRVMEVVPGGDDTRPALRDYPGGYDYYLYRSGLDADLAPDASPARQTSAAGEGSSATESGKPAPSREEQRKQRSRLKKLERQEEELLGKLEANEERQREIEAQMALPEAYADGERMRRLKADLEAARLDHEGLSGRWAEVDGELSTLRDQS